MIWSTSFCPLYSCHEPLSNHLQARHGWMNKHMTHCDSRNSSHDPTTRDGAALRRCKAATQHEVIANSFRKPHRCVHKSILHFSSTSKKWENPGTLLSRILVLMELSKALSTPAGARLRRSAATWAVHLRGVGLWRTTMVRTLPTACSRLQNVGIWAWDVLCWFSFLPGFWGLEDGHIPTLWLLLLSRGMKKYRTGTLNKGSRSDPLPHSLLSASQIRVSRGPWPSTVPMNTPLSGVFTWADVRLWHLLLLLGPPRVPILRSHIPNIAVVPQAPDIAIWACLDAQ